MSDRSGPLPTIGLARWIACASVLLYIGVIAFRPLNANDLFWHIAAGREILTSGGVPQTDPFSFASGAAPWIDHEWLWQVVACVLGGGSSGPTGPMAPRVALILIAVGVLAVLLAFCLGLGQAAREGLPAAGIVAAGLLAAEVVRDRVMVRPETASLLMVAVMLTLLARVAPGIGRALALCGLAALWSNVHPAVLAAPVLVAMYALGERFGAAPRVRERSPAMLLLEPLLTLAGTFANPYGARLWKVPFALKGLVRNPVFYNPEWLPPPPSRFPLFYVAAVLLLAAGAASVIRLRRPPRGAVLVAIALGVLAARQMRHLGLFGIAFLFAAAPVIRALDFRGVLERTLARTASVAACLGGALLAIGGAVAGARGVLAEGGLDPGRFPVGACEAVAAAAPAGMRLYNDVKFGGYLIWRFFPGRKVLIDGRNEVYPELLDRLGRIRSGGPGSYDEWRGLVRDLRIEGAIVQYNDSKKGVIYPPLRPGAEPERGYRAWSAYLFPTTEWGLVYFDDTAMVFMKRGGGGAGWLATEEYRDLNPEDEAYLLAGAAHDPALAERLRLEAGRRLRTLPSCRRAAAFLERLEATVPPPAIR